MIIFDTGMMRDYISAAKRASNNLEKANSDLRKVISHDAWTCPEKNDIDANIQNYRNDLKKLSEDTLSYCLAVENALTEFEDKENLLSRLFNKVVGSIKKWVSDTVDNITETVQKVSSWLASLFERDTRQDNEIVLFPELPDVISNQDIQWGDEIIVLKTESFMGEHAELIALLGISKEEFLECGKNAKNENELNDKLCELLISRADRFQFEKSYGDPNNDGLIYLRLSTGGYYMWQNCTWYATGRYNETHGHTPIVNPAYISSNGSPNGGVYTQMLDSNSYNITSSQDADYSNIKGGIATGYPYGGPYGHVVYIEDCIGNNVVFSERITLYDGGPSVNRIQIKSIDDFKKQYSTVAVEK